jgi:hypothetical protein
MWEVLEYWIPRIKFSITRRGSLRIPKILDLRMLHLNILWGTPQKRRLKLQWQAPDRSLLLHERPRSNLL